MKTLKIIIACILTTTTSVAQYYTDGAPDQRDILQFGIKVGANNSNLYDTRGQDFVALQFSDLFLEDFCLSRLGAFWVFNRKFFILQKAMPVPDQWGQNKIPTLRFQV